MDKNKILEKIRACSSRDRCKKMEKTKTNLQRPAENTQDLYENTNKFIQLVKKNLYSPKRLTFKEWLSAVEDMIDEL